MDALRLLSLMPRTRSLRDEPRYTVSQRLVPTSTLMCFPMRTYAFIYLYLCPIASTGRVIAIVEL